MLETNVGNVEIFCWSFGWNQTVTLFSAFFMTLQIVHAYFYHLQAEQDYDVDFFGKLYNLFGFAGADLESTRTQDNFTTRKKPSNNLYHINFLPFHHAVLFSCTLYDPNLPHSKIISLPSQPDLF